MAEHRYAEADGRNGWEVAYLEVRACGRVLARWTIELFPSLSPAASQSTKVALYALMAVAGAKFASTGWCACSKGDLRPSQAPRTQSALQIRKGSN